MDKYPTALISTLVCPMVLTACYSTSSSHEDTDPAPTENRSSRRTENDADDTATPTDTESIGQGEKVGVETDAPPVVDTEMPADTEIDSDSGSPAICESHLYDPCCLETPPEYEAICDRLGHELDCALHYCCDAFNQQIVNEYFDGCTAGPHCVDPPHCGDGILDSDNEECDDGNSIPGDGCSGTCTQEPYYLCGTPGEPCTTIVVCGDGVIDPGEICDDGNTVSGDGCDSTCTSQEPGYLCEYPGDPCIPTENCGTDCPTEPSCGDGYVQRPDESCDDGVNDGGYGECAPGCILGPRCGDGLVQADDGEGCDDGELNGTYGFCNSDCSRELACGDGLLQPEYEMCDNGVNDGGYDACGPSCTVEQYCGDGILQIDFENCDDGEHNGEYGMCSVQCRETVRCGDGITQWPYESCDDGNSIPNDTCDNQCRCGEPQPLLRRLPELQVPPQDTAPHRF